MQAVQIDSIITGLGEAFMIAITAIGMTHGMIITDIIVFTAQDFQLIQVLDLHGCMITIIGGIMDHRIAAVSGVPILTITPILFMAMEDIIQDMATEVTTPADLVQVEITEHVLIGKLIQVGALQEDTILELPAELSEQEAVQVVRKDILLLPIAAEQAQGLQTDQVKVPPDLQGQPELNKRVHQENLLHPVNKAGRQNTPAQKELHLVLHQVHHVVQVAALLQEAAAVVEGLQETGSFTVLIIDTL